MDTFTKRDANGAVDIAASSAAYAEALAAWVAEHEISSERIENAVEAVFDAHPGRLPMTALVGMAVVELGGSPDQFKALTDRVRAYIKGQTGAGRLTVKKGTGGGVDRNWLPGETPAE